MSDFINWVKLVIIYFFQMIGMFVKQVLLRAINFGRQGHSLTQWKVL
jgi:hypothetical protein